MSSDPIYFPPGIDYRDISDQMCEAYNELCCHTVELPPLEADWVYQVIQDTFHDDDIELLLHDDFGKGIVMGRLATLKTFDEMQDAEQRTQDEDYS